MNGTRTAVAIVATLAGCAHTHPPDVDPGKAAPALMTYDRESVEQDLWQRDELSARDRSLVTVAALVASGRTSQQAHHMALALDNGVTPVELSELVTHVAFYAGWPVGKDGATELARVFEALDIEPTPSNEPPITLDPEREEARKKSVAQIEPIVPGLAHFTNELLFASVWRRPGLAPRDRSLVTVATLIATGQAEQLGFHVRRAMENGLTRAEASEVVAHLAFYSGWPRAFSAAGPLAEILGDDQSSSEDDAPSEVTVIPKEEAGSFDGPEDKFTGEVHVDSLFEANLEGDNGGGVVHFSPGAHTAWHSHPRGQTLIVTEGTGWVQQDGKPRQTMRTGDVVRIPPNTRHWHGATADSAMTHVAIAESVDGSSTEWMEHVSQDTYLAR